MTASPSTVRRDDSASDPAETARRLAAMAERLAPNWERPERWHEQKSELVSALRRHARRLDQGMDR